MIKFLKKYRNVSLISGALMIAVVSGVSGAFVYKENVGKRQTQRVQRAVLQMPNEWGYTILLRELNPCSRDSKKTPFPTGAIPTHELSTFAIPSAWGKQYCLPS